MFKSNKNTISQKKSNGYYFKGSFGIIVFSIFLSLCGFILITQLPLSKLPDIESSKVYINFSWSNSTAFSLEEKVTTPIESSLSTLTGLRNIESVSNNSWGYITLTFDKTEDIALKRYQISQLISTLYPNLPEGVQYPTISIDKNEDNQLLKSYTIFSVNDENIGEKILSKIKNKLLTLEDISFRISGASDSIIVVRLDNNRIRYFNIKKEEIKRVLNKVINNNSFSCNCSSSENEIILFKSLFRSPKEWHNLPIKNIDKKTIYLKDIGEIVYSESQAKEHFRINGQKAILINILSKTGGNAIKLSSELNDIMSALDKELPHGFKLQCIKDNTVKLRKNFSRAVIISSLTFIFLLLFIVFFSSSRNQISIISISSFCTIGICFLCYYVFQLELHLYTLAGFTISLGLVVDNIIVMSNHLNKTGNIKAINALLASTITSIISLSIIFFLKDNIRIMLKDFAFIVIINLFVSLFMALFLIPSLYDRINRKSKAIDLSRSKRRIRYFINYKYFRFHPFLYRYRRIVFLLIILFFGLPVFLIPHKIESKYELINSFYTNSFGSRIFISHIKPLMTKVLGGSLTVFHKTNKELEGENLNDRSSLTITSRISDPITLTQLNEAYISIEKLLHNIEGIAYYKTNIFGVQSANLQIFFKPEYDNNDYPSFLKQQLISKVNSISSIDWIVTGYGRSFHNYSENSNQAYTLVLSGYNFQKLFDIAGELMNRLTENSRNSNIEIKGHRKLVQNTNKGYKYIIDSENIIHYNFFSSIINSSFDWNRPNPGLIGTYIGPNERTKVYVEETKQNKLQLWNFSNSEIVHNGNKIKLKNKGAITIDETSIVIRKRNQQYQAYIGWDFNGSSYLGKEYFNFIVKEFKQKIPIGYDIQKEKINFNRKVVEKSNLLQIVVIIFLIYVICSILFESLKQPLIVVSILPMTFIGAFLSFGIFKLPFDYGGFASFILLTGLTVNSSIFIINEFNNQKKVHKFKSNYYCLKKALQLKTMPILLTIISTSLGLLPFILIKQSESFWKTFSTVTISGLIFSLVGIFFIIPLFFISQKKYHENIY